MVYWSDCEASLTRKDSNEYDVLPREGQGILISGWALYFSGDGKIKVD
jgi:hypothetical protein